MKFLDLFLNGKKVEPLTGGPQYGWTGSTGARSPRWTRLTVPKLATRAGPRGQPRQQRRSSGAEVARRWQPRQRTRWRRGRRRSVARLAGATRHGEPNGGYQGDEELAWMLGLTETAAVGVEMTGGDEERRRRDSATGGDGVPAGSGRNGCAHEVRRDEAVPEVESVAAEEAQRRR